MIKSSGCQLWPPDHTGSTRRRAPRTTRCYTTSRDAIASFGSGSPTGYALSSARSAKCSREPARRSEHRHRGSPQIRQTDARFNIHFGARHGQLHSQSSDGRQTSISPKNGRNPPVIGSNSIPSGTFLFPPGTFIFLSRTSLFSFGNVYIFSVQLRRARLA